MKVFTLFFLVILLPLSAQKYEPLTGEARLKSFAKSTYGVQSLLLAGPYSSAWGTLINTPEEWGPHWGGFGKRYGVRLLNNTVTNGLEISSGAIWNEDPRYFPRGQGPVRQRVGHALKLTWMSRYGNGEYHFGAAKAVGVVGGSFSQKLWMPNSVTSNGDCLVRIGTNYAGRLVGNLFLEFSPEIMKKLKRKKN